MKNNCNTVIDIKMTRDQLSTYFYQISSQVNRWRHVADNYANFYRQMLPDDPSAFYIDVIRLKIFNAELILQVWKRIDDSDESAFEPLS